MATDRRLGTAVLVLTLLLQTVFRAAPSDATILTIASGVASCPRGCTCRAESGDGNAYKLLVRCVNGGLNDDGLVKLLAAMPPRSTSIYISGTEQNPNIFSMSQDFDRFHDLEELYLINCGIRSLGKRMFDRLPKLKILHLEGNKVHYILPEAFENARQIETLVLKNNEISIDLLPTGVFSGLRSLRAIDLSSNRKEGPLPPNTFAGLTSVTSIILENSLILDQDFKAFDDIPNLQRIRLSNCSIRVIPPSAFQQHSVLREVSLNDNNELGLESIGQLLTNVPALQSLDISGDLQNIVVPGRYPGAGRWPLHHNLRRLTMRRCRLDDSVLGRMVLNRMLAGVTSVAELDLCQNAFRHFSADMIVAVAGSLKKLRLCQNRIDIINGVFLKGLTQLRYLDLSDNAIRRLPTEIPTEFLQLDHLNLSGNDIKSITERQLASLSALRSLDLSRCNLTLSSNVVEGAVNSESDSTMHVQRRMGNDSSDRNDQSSPKALNTDIGSEQECLDNTEDGDQTFAASGQQVKSCANMTSNGYGAISVLTIVLVATLSTASLLLIAVLFVRYRKVVYRTREEKEAPFRQNYFAADNLDEKYLHCDVYSVLEDSSVHSAPKLADINDV